MSHPDDNTLRLLGTGRLDDDRETRVEAHLAACSTCRERLDRLERRTPDALLYGMKLAADPVNDVFETNNQSSSQAHDGGLHVGQRIGGNYRLEKQLGRGGMGVVWKAYDETAERPVVLKFVPDEIRHISEAMDSVRESFRKVHALQHQHICPVYGLLDDSEHGLCLVMKFIDGVPLNIHHRQCVEDRGPLTLDEIVRILAPVAVALDYAHARKVIHRDIKPQNIMVGGTDGVQVIDFGIADEIRATLSQVNHNIVANISGTRSYMAPEQWEGRKQDARTDQYALAVTAYQLLSGRVPFYGSDTDILRKCVLTTPPAPIVDQPAHVNEALLKALAKNREERYDNCKTFIEALSGKTVTKIVGSNNATSVFTLSYNAKRHIVVIAVLTVFVILAGIVMVAANRSEREQEVPSASISETKSTISIPEPAYPLVHRIAVPAIPVVRMNLRIDSDGQGCFTVKRTTSTDFQDDFHGTPFSSKEHAGAQTFRAKNGLERILYDIRNTDFLKEHSLDETLFFRQARPNSQARSLRFEASPGDGLSGDDAERYGFYCMGGKTPLRVACDIIHRDGSLPSIALLLKMKNGRYSEISGGGSMDANGLLRPAGICFLPKNLDQCLLDFDSLHYVSVGTEVEVRQGETFSHEFRIPQSMIDATESICIAVMKETESPLFNNQRVLRPIVIKDERRTIKSPSREPTAFDLTLLDIVGRFDDSPESEAKEHDIPLTRTTQNLPQ